jgi:hypothetical protein
MYSGRKTTKAVTLKYAKTIHCMLQNLAVVLYLQSGLKGQSHQIMDYILDSVKLNLYFLQDRLWFLHFSISYFLNFFSLFKLLLENTY